MFASQNLLKSCFSFCWTSWECNICLRVQVDLEENIDNIAAKGADTIANTKVLIKRRFGLSPYYTPKRNQQRILSEHFVSEAPQLNYTWLEDLFFKRM